jgi:hypothetical protein
MKMEIHGFVVVVHGIGVECIIRSKLDTQSGLSWTLNPELTGQSIR